MKKIFLDCGAHTGGSVRHFCKTRPDWPEYYIVSFEPDPQHWDKWPISIKLPEYEGNIIEASAVFDVTKNAVWTSYGTNQFHITQCEYRPEGGSTLNETKHRHNVKKYTDPNYAYMKFKFDTIDVQCIDLAYYIKALVPADDKENYHVVLKIDIEGAEYEVIRHLIDTNAMALVDELYGEWHNWRCGRCERPANVHKYKSPEDLALEKEILDKFGIVYKDWDCIDV
jgi:FkbM family methyltransferase